MESYSARDDGGQNHLQATFPKIMNEAAGACGLRRNAWTLQSTGDGELAIFPVGTSEPQVVADLVPAIDRALREQNRFSADHVQVRLRAALHQGLVWPSPNGFAGQAVVKVCRLVDAQPVREALDLYPDAGVALIVSSDMFRDVISQSYPGIRADRYRKVHVQVKTFDEEAWIFVPDEDINRGPGGGAPQPRPPMSTDTHADSSTPAPSVGSRSSIGTINNHGAFIVGDHGRIGGASDGRL
jgi:hypothetical protein